MNCLDKLLCSLMTEVDGRNCDQRVLLQNVGIMRERERERERERPCDTPYTLRPSRARGIATQALRPQITKCTELLFKKESTVEILPCPLKNCKRLRAPGVAYATVLGGEGHLVCLF